MSDSVRRVCGTMLAKIHVERRTRSRLVAEFRNFILKLFYIRARKPGTSQHDEADVAQARGLIQLDDRRWTRQDGRLIALCVWCEYVRDERPVKRAC